MRPLFVLLAAAVLTTQRAALAQAMPAMPGMEHHHHPSGGAPVDASAGPAEPAAHGHDLGPAGATYDLRFIDGMVQHHNGALLMSEFVFDIGAPGVGALAKAIWSDQAQEIQAMGQWRKAWFPEAPVYPVAYLPGGDPDSLAGVTRMSTAQIAAMRMMQSLPTRNNRITWFLEGMLQHHGGALIMAHDALRKSTNPTIVRLAMAIIRAQRQDIVKLRRMLLHDGLSKPEYYAYDSLFSLK